MQKLSEKKRVLGVGFTTDSSSIVLEYITQLLAKGGPKTLIVTPNPEMLLLARKDKHFNDVLNSAQIALPDGIGVVRASKLLGRGIKGRITGVDFMEMLVKGVSLDFEKVTKRQASIGLLGGRGGVAKRTAVCLGKKYPGVRYYYYDGDVVPGKFKFQIAKMRSSQEEVNGGVLKPKRLDILFVAFGFPKQEEWISANLPHIPVVVGMGVGGAFDILSGEIARAPKVMQRAGLEWSWRLIREPRRIKRQIKLVLFPYHVLREKFNRR